MSSFFSAPASQRKRKRQDAANTSSKRRNVQNTARQQRSRPTRAADQSSISGSDASGEEDVSDHDAASRVGSDTNSDEEALTAADRRRKLAERYLDNVRADLAEDEDGFAGGFNAEDVDRDLIAARLKDDVAEDKGRVYRRIADTLDAYRARKVAFRADTLATTGVASSHPYVYTVSKDATLIKWKLVPPEWSEELKNATAKKGCEPPRRRKPKQVTFTKGNKSRAGQKGYMHHTDGILCVAASADGKFVATGGLDKRLIIWDAKTLDPLRVFTQHRDAVTSVAFRGKTNQLFSASKDRTVRIWSLNEMAYVETLFGHQDEVLDVAAAGGSQERCISVGARDRTARLWKVVEESQLVFRGGASTKLDALTDVEPANEPGPKPLRILEGSLDRVVQLDTQLFVTGSDSGALSLFSLHKKKPLHVLSLAHGLDPALAPEQSSAEADPAKQQTSGQPIPRGITALACIPFSDFFVSGSWEGCVRAWRLSEDQKRIESAGILSQGSLESDNADKREDSTEAEDRIPARGVINDLTVFSRGDRGKDGACVVAAVGTEPRSGRWFRVKGKNCAMVFEIAPREPGSLHNGMVREM